MNNPSLRHAAISIFVILWLVVFHYESLRYQFLDPLFKKNLPKVKLLFPPAGWIMFYRVEDSFGTVEVYGIKNGRPQLIDPHDIFRTRTIAYDNIHRNILSSAARQEMARPFCRYLRWRFPYFEDFAIVGVDYPSLVQEPFQRFEQVLYRCEDVSGVLKDEVRP